MTATSLRKALKSGNVTDAEVLVTGGVTARTLGDHLATLPDSKITATGGSAARTLADIFGDWSNLKDDGAAGDGVTDDTAAVTLAEANAKKTIFTPEGTYDTTLTTLTKKYFGFGQIDENGNLRAPFYAHISAAPSSSGSESSLNTAFDGDLSKLQFAIGQKITGTATLGQPALGVFKNNPEAGPVYIFAENESGHNESTSGASGRTAVAGIRTRIRQVGQGDMICFSGEATVLSTKSGSTSFLANPAAAIINGQVSGTIAGAYLQGGEFKLADQSTDCAGIGFVYNLKRNNSTGAKDAFWAGVKIQSSEGTKAIDAAFLVGPGDFVSALDLTTATLASAKAAIIMKEDDRIYFEGTAGTFVAATVGNSYIEYNSGNSELTLVSDGTKVLGSQGTAVADASGGATIDAEARTAINALLARARAHGIIAT